MKKLVSILCSMALLLAVCVPAYATTADPAAYAAAVESDLMQRVQIGDHYYQFVDNSGHLSEYLTYLATQNGYVASNAKQITDGIDYLKDFVENDSGCVAALNSDNLQSVWNTVKAECVAQYNSSSALGTAMNALGLAPTVPSFVSGSIVIAQSDLPSGSVTGNVALNIVRTAVPSKNDNSDSTSSPSTPTAPADSSQTTVTTGANGATAVGVTTAPDTAPTVSGGTASVVATVPAAAISTAAATATAEKPASVVISAPAAAMVGQMNSSAVQSVAVTMKVPSDVAYGTASNVNVAMNLDSSVLKAAGQTGKNVTVGVVDQMTGKEAYSWTFKGSDLAGAGSVGSVNMALRVSTSTLDSQISGKVPASDKGVVLAFGNNGTLPAPATVRVLVSNQGYQPGQQIHMYYYNSATNQVEALDNSTYTVDADGYVSVVIKHCSKYILSTGVLAAVQPVKLDTGKKLSVKAGKTYQFKVTASAKPAFTSGNNSVFKVSANGSKGSDYFFKVTAVGKVGQSTGFYVNGEKTPRTVGTIVS